MKKGYTYQVGGSLQLNAPSYMPRAADTELLTELLAGEYCYVFNARQMGKSSLRVHLQAQLQARGRRCVSLDLTGIGSEHITPAQWYKGLVLELLTKFDLGDRLDFKGWWQSYEDYSDVLRLRLFIEEVLLANYPQDRLFILVDEIDSALTLPFSVDDFFALVRYCYNQRGMNPAFSRLTWALFGVATPSDLIADPLRTPFNIGRAIELRGLTWDSALQLAAGLTGYVAFPETVMAAIWTWTNGQPFLTQKLCDLVVRQAAQAPLMTESQMALDWVDELVTTKVLSYWESQDNPEHLRTIRDRILHDQSKAARLLSLYQQILTATVIDGQPSHQDLAVAYDDSPEQLELLLSGLVEQRQGRLTVKNRIYQEIFNGHWVEQQLARLRPYAESLRFWTESARSDPSRLLSGQALRDAEAWSLGKRLSDIDYQFLAASQKHEQQLLRDHQEAARFRLKDRLLKREQLLRRWLSALSTVLALALVLALTFGFLAVRQSRQLQVGRVDAIATTANILFASEHYLDSLLQAIKAAQLARNFHLNGAHLQQKITSALQQAIFGLDEINRFSVVNKSGLQAIALSHNGRLVVSGGEDTQLRLWDRQGRLQDTWHAHEGPVEAIDMSPDNQWIVSASRDHTFKLWSPTGEQLLTFEGHLGGVNAVAFSPDQPSRQLVSASDDRTVKLWQLDGKLLATFTDHRTPVTAVDFGPEGLIVSGSQAGNVILWHRSGRRLQTLSAHTAEISDIAFNPTGEQFVTASYDGTAKLWDLNGHLLATLAEHDAGITAVAFSADGQQLATASWDRSIRLWDRDGHWLTTLKGHNDRIEDVVFGPDGQSLLSASLDGTVRVWNLSKFIAKTLFGHQADVLGLAVSASGQTIASGGADNTLKLWNRRGQILATWPQTETILAIDFGPEGKTVVAASADGLVRRWGLDGQLQQVFKGHQAAVWDVAISPDGQTLATAGEDQTIKFWNRQGENFRTLFAHRQPVRAIDYSADGRYLASTGLDGQVHVWDSQGMWQRSFQRTYRGAGKLGFMDVALSPDGQLIAAAGLDQTVEIWRIDGTHLTTLRGHEQAVRSITFSSTSTVIVSASDDQTIKLWDVQGTLLSTLRGHTGAVSQVRLIEWDDVLLSASEDRTVTLWRPELYKGIDRLLEYGCSAIRSYLRNNQALTAEERTLCP